MNLPPSGGIPKKDSIFSGLAPAPAPAPLPAARPSVDADAVAALKQKIDSLEKNIVSQLEKKMGEQLKQAAPAPQPAPARAQPQQADSSDVLTRKLEEMERRLADFNQVAALSASQLKNIEESKIGARREIEDLLKAVREQQKYSEMDRQIHDQLERAWTRAEELEKKLMEFYSSVLAMEAKRRDEAAAASDKSASAVDALAARLAGLEDKISALTSGVESKVGGLSSQVEGKVGQLATGLDQKVSALAAMLDQKLSALTSGPAADEMKRASAEFFSVAEQERAALKAVQAEFFARLEQDRHAVKEVQEDFMARAEQDRRALLAAQDAAAREMRAAMSENFAAVEEFRKAMREQASAAADKFERLEKLSRSGSAEVAAAQQELRELFSSQSKAAEDFWARLDASLSASGERQAAGVKKEVSDQLEKFGAAHAKALVSADFLENFRASVDAAVGQLEAFQAPLEKFLADIPAERLAKAMGVSGDILRADYHALAAAAKSIDDRLAALRVLKSGLEKHAGDAFGGR